MAAVARPPSQPSKDAPSALMRPADNASHVFEVDYGKLPRGTSKKEGALSEAAAKRIEISDSRLDTVSRATA